ncbi:hypothetical protein A3D88_00005 [Candidatus Peribacteria bacterium RIFCSPHIGHO2_02_FULL_52_16]|nr:MAG: hypothetical protein A2706_04850 [Candidatus Peribacteria bacterium RIFCSPHIGHO2_01_FULL_51_35]OGJ61509.1 MAG: hypothetical protein A3D88_00005 [Candidatus Peribacteria bacterium RIFCSPHIGHO2_02_FULL_52_16]
MNIAIVADWLTVFGGAERVVAELHAVFPQAPIFTTVAHHKNIGQLKDADLRTSSLQKWYRLFPVHQLFISMMPRAVERFDLTGMEVIVSSSHAVAKGIIPPSDAVHICYCHTPMRYAWEMEKEYLDDFRVPQFLRKSIKKRLSDLRRWDMTTARRVDVFLANSKETQERIRKIYGRESTVLPPPVHQRFFDIPLNAERSSFLAVGRLVPYKRFDLLIALANKLHLPLTIVGTGHEERRLKAMAGATITFRGRVEDAELPELYRSSNAVFFAPHEDAGIVPMEAQACGTPVIAYGKGGALDTIIDGETGVFFEEQTVESLEKTFRRFSTITFDEDKIREHAKKFSAGQFRKQWKEILEKALAKN